MAETADILKQRSSTHGDFKTNAILSQEIKILYRDGHYDSLSYVHKEALDMIALKLSRILSGHANFRDHWDDIAGYAKLASDCCDE